MAANTSHILLLDGIEVPDEGKEIAPTWILLLYLGLVVGGGVINNILLACAICRKKDSKDSNLLILILYLACVDISTLMLVAPFEVLVLGNGDEAWNFSETYCPVFLSLEVLLGSASVYFLVALNIHALILRTQLISHEESEEAEENEIVNLSAKVPVFLVWLLAISLTIPEFMVSEIVLARPHYRVCTLRQDAIAHVLMAVFRVGVPVFALLVCSLTAALRLCGEASPSVTLRHQLLRVALLLSLSYAALSLHRSIFSVLHIFVPAGTPREPDAFKVPPLANVALSPKATLVFAMIHYALSSLRPFLYCVASPMLRSMLAGCSCCRSQPNTPT